MSVNCGEPTYSVRWCGISGFNKFSSDLKAPEKVGLLKQLNGGGPEAWGNIQKQTTFFKYIYIHAQ